MLKPNEEAIKEFITLVRRDPFAIYRTEDAYRLAEMLGMEIKGNNLCYEGRTSELKTVRFYKTDVPINKYISASIKIPTTKIEESNGVANDTGFGIGHFVIAVAELLTGKEMPEQVCTFPSSMYYAMEVEEISKKAIQTLEEHLSHKITEDGLIQVE